MQGEAFESGVEDGTVRHNYITEHNIWEFLLLEFLLGSGAVRYL